MLRVPPWLVRPLPRDVGRLPYLWLVYLTPFLLRPLAGHGSAPERIASWLLLAVFLWSYHQTYSATPRMRRVHVAVQAMVGLALLPWNPGAVVFFIFAAAAAGMLEPDRAARIAIAAVLLLGTGWAALVDGQAFTIAAAAITPPLIGAATLYQERERRASAALRAATAQNAALAATAERERIARDLHDALGHTLSLVVLKAQVARRLATPRPNSEPQPGAVPASDERAARLANELEELEVAARGALAEVRQAVRGYRATLDDALRAARTLLEAAGTTVTVDVALREPDPPRDALLAAVIRELATNVARHAAARTCEIRVREDAAHTTLTVRDDGRGGATLESHGLRGVAERLAAVGGHLRLDDAASARGTTLVAVLPRRAGAPEPAGAPDERAPHGSSRDARRAARAWGAERRGETPTVAAPPVGAAAVRAVAS